MGLTAKRMQAELAASLLSGSFLVAACFDRLQRSGYEKRYAVFFGLLFWCYLFLVSHFSVG